MKRLIIISLFLLSQLSFSQTKDAFELCYALQQNFNQFTSNSEANDVLNRILYVTGATPNFILMECDKINNAVAVTYKGQRYILYDKEFLSLVSRNSTSWSNTFILAHEVGHHINGHTKDIALGSILSEQELEQQRKQELDADYYAGFVLAKLGASLSETNAAINLISSQGDDRFSTHPDRNKRIEAITRGWNNGVERNVSQENTLLPSEEKLSGEWIQFRSGKENPFDDEEVYAYTIGRTYPVNANTYNIRPKLVVGVANQFLYWYITDMNLPTEFNISYEIISSKEKVIETGELLSSTRYFITDVSTGIEIEISSEEEFNLLRYSRGVEYSNPREEDWFFGYHVDKEKNQLEEIILRELELNKDEIYNSIINQSRDSREEGEDYSFSLVWNDEEKTHVRGICQSAKGVYISCEYGKGRLYLNSFLSKKFEFTSRVGYDEPHFVENLRSKDRLLLKPNFWGNYVGRHLIDKPHIQIKLSITLERVIPDDIYFEFDLKGSSKALLFD